MNKYDFSFVVVNGVFTFSKGSESDFNGIMTSLDNEGVKPQFNDGYYSVEVTKGNYLLDTYIKVNGTEKFNYFLSFNDNTYTGVVEKNCKWVDTYKGKKIKRDITFKP